MRRHAPGIGAEIVGLLLVLASLVGTLAATLAMYRPKARVPEPAPSAVAAPEPLPKARPQPKPILPAQPSEPPEDPTKPILARFEQETATERQARDELAGRLDQLAAAGKQLDAQISLWHERERSVRDQARRLDVGLDQLDSQLDEFAHERDVLAKLRDEAKKEVLIAGSKDSLAVLPYRGPNGTWRRPIPIECVNNEARIQPGGPSFSMFDLALGVRMRPSPFAAAVGQYLTHAQMQNSPDGQVVVPYVLFIVRPDGIGPYYEARATLEPLGIAFGYELVGQDEQLDFPDLDLPAEWSEKPDWKFARNGFGSPRPAPIGTGPSGTSATPRDDPADFVWPTEPPSWASVSPSPNGGPNGAFDPGGAGLSGDPRGTGNAIGLDELLAGGPLTSGATELGSGQPHPHELTEGGDRNPPANLGQLPGRDQSGWPSERFGNGGLAWAQQPGNGTTSGLAGTPAPGAGNGQGPSSRPGGGRSEIASSGSSDLVPGSVGDHLLNGGNGRRSGSGYRIMSSSGGGSPGYWDSSAASSGAGNGGSMPGNGLGPNTAPNASSNPGMGTNAVANSGGGPGSTTGTSASPTGTQNINEVFGRNLDGMATSPGHAGSGPGLSGGSPGSNNDTPESGIGAFATESLAFGGDMASAAPSSVAGGGQAGGSNNAGRGTGPASSNPALTGTQGPAGSGPDAAMSSTTSPGSNANAIAAAGGGTGAGAAAASSSPPPAGGSPGSAASSSSSSGSVAAAAPHSNGSPGPNASAGASDSSTANALPAPSLGLDLGGSKQPGGQRAYGSSLDFRPQRALEMVVVCDAHGVLIQPGGYRLSASTLTPGDSRLVQTLRMSLSRKERQDPKADIKPRLTFVVTPGGETTYWKARRQTVMIGLGWPVRLKVAEGEPIQIARGGWTR